MEGDSLPKGERILKSIDRAIEEKAKPFQLVKYFTITSLILIFLGTIILSMLNTHWARAMQREKSEEYARLIIENLNHQIFLQFIMPVVLRYGKIQLRNEEQYELMDKVVRNTLHSFNVEKVNIYDMNNVIFLQFRSGADRQNQHGRYRLPSSGGRQIGFPPGSTRQLFRDAFRHPERKPIRHLCAAAGGAAAGPGFQDRYWA
jgi:hypothetical protein